MPELTSPALQDALARLTQSAAIYDPTLRGFLCESGPPLGQTTAAPVSQSEIATKIWLPPGGAKITGSMVNVSTGGATLTGAQNLVTLYSAAGTKIASCADQSAVWTGTGNFAADFTGGPFTLTDPYCWVSLLSNGTTPATFRALNGNAAWTNVGFGGTLTGAAVFAGRIGTAVTAPATFTPSGLVITGTALYWIGLY